MCLWHKYLSWLETTSFLLSHDRSARQLPRRLSDMFRLRSCFWVQSVVVNIVVNHCRKILSLGLVEVLISISSILISCFPQ